MRPSILKLLKPDIIVEMLEMVFQFENWDKLLNTSDILYSYAQCIYEERQYFKAKRLPVPHVEMARPLVYYYGFSHLMRGTACQKQGQYDQARESINKYAELGWMEDLGEEGMQIVEEFKFLARANGYALDILSGKTERLAEYVAFLQDNPEELLPGLDTVLQAALRHNLNVDHLLDAFAEQEAEFGEYEDAGNVSHYYSYCYHLALYHKQAGRQDQALTYVMRSLILAHDSGNDRNFKKSMALFESLREGAAEERLQQFEERLRGCLMEERQQPV
ncbi:tetratricopeptide (TPR) repeat protein [Paenibacillus forsythiae]|uniref:Tetratricopeptide (TPR) repeat protein n=1 Tax=Paenibacillus forsythiae TaxID=365616 RepID=A0ABU3H384_9BACL|nr:DNA-binding protein [Paenibacillus forsythiae]MDT3425288.1 tetratricopeptide (TPR) repeat protein [Paenibacillus forsythiae]